MMHGQKNIKQVHILTKHQRNCLNTTTYTHLRITKQVQSITVQDTHQMK